MSINIVKSNRDKSEYTGLVLENGLRVVLISNPDINTDTVSLSVGVGSYEDGEVMGMAHFLEHMLFLGNEEYPGVGEYNKFIQENGGYSNAYTSYDHTCYFYTINNAQIDKSLDIFSGFFECPLLDKNYVNKEMNAVNSEHEKNKLNDNWREDIVMYELTNKTTPIKKFSTGTLSTLNIPDIREKVKDFMNKYYSANIMNLVIMSKTSLVSLESMVKKYFSKIKNNNVTIKREYNSVFNKQSWVDIIPIKNNNKLQITWEVDVNRSDLKYKILPFIGHILGHEGEKTFGDYLMTNQYVKRFVIGEDVFVDNKSLFNAIFSLTDEGVNRCDKIYNGLYKLIDMVKNAPKNEIQKLYEEQRTVKQLLFDYMEINDTTGYVTGISALLCISNIELSNIISHQYVYEEWSDDIYNRIMDVLKQLVPENSVGMYCSQKNETTETDKWYGVQYKLYDSMRYKLMDNMKFEFSIPKLNRFMCTDQNMLDIQKMEIPLPYKLCEKHDNIEIYWRQDITYKTPYISAIFYFENNKIVNDPKEYLICSLYSNCVSHYMNSISYEFSMSGYSVSVSISPVRTYIVCYGCPQNMKQVLLETLNYIMLLNPSIEVFNNVKKEYKKNLENARLAEPYAQVEPRYMESCIPEITNEKMLEIIDVITFDDIINYPKLCTQRRVCLLEGNIQHEQLEFLSEMILFSNNMKEKLTDQSYLKLVNPPKSYVHYNPTSSLEMNNSVGVYYNLGYSKIGVGNWLEMEVFKNIYCIGINPQFFDNLRTSQQLGYVVNLRQVIVGDSRYPYYSVRFLVQSDHKNDDYIINEIHKFVKEAVITEPQFNTIKQSYIDTLSEPFKSLIAQSEYNIKCIIKNVYTFDINKQLIQYAQNYSYENYKQTLDRFIVQNDNITTISVGHNKN